MTRVSMFGQLGGNVKLSGQLRGGGGGDRITIEPTLLSGQKIADYEINGESGELYCINDYNDLDNLPTIINPVDMVGASAGDDGSAGYVPKPVAGDEGKVLYGDGTWKTPAVGINYSTSEQDTGLKWIDDKPIYQKTFLLTIPNSSGGHLFTEAAIPNLDIVVDAYYGLSGGPRHYVSWYTSYNILFDEQTSVGVEFNFASTGLAGRTLYYTVRYTKAA